MDPGTMMKKNQKCIHWPFEYSTDSAQLQIRLYGDYLPTESSFSADGTGFEGLDVDKERTWVSIEEMREMARLLDRAIPRKLRAKSPLIRNFTGLVIQLGGVFLIEPVAD